MKTHRDRLREELLHAAERRGNDVHRGSARSLKYLVVAAALFLVGLLGTGWLTVTSTPAAADVFEVERTGSEIVVSVVDTVDDPDEARSELEAEGIRARLVGRPSAPSLVGAITAVSSGELDLSQTFDGRRLAELRIPVAPQEPELVLEYGRRAMPGEDYAVTESSTICAGLFGRQLSRDLLSQVRRVHGPELRLQTVGGDILNPDDSLLPRLSLVDILPLASDRVLVLATELGTQAPSDIGCGE